MSLQEVTHGTMEKLERDYEELLPLLNYLKARLKYDTVRWIRAYGTKDDIVFSTRIKGFDRVYDKLVRKGELLSKQSSLLDIILSGRRILDDVVGIRFICFDAYHIYRLVRYFLITERVITSHREFYVSSKADLSYPIYRFLQSNGFTSIQKSDRHYEDINFIIQFSHPIDKYFQSGIEQFESLAQRTQPPEASEKLVLLNKLFEELKTHDPDLIRSISQIPIECQIVTATQHIYNRTQRPHYEFILQAKDEQPAIPERDVMDLAERLDLLKLNLLATDMNVYAIHRKLGIRYEVPSRINPGDLFKLAGRLPKDILGENRRIEKINTELLPTLISPDKNMMNRAQALAHLFKDVAHIDSRIIERARVHGDIAPGKLLNVDDLDQLTHPEIVFWTVQRMILLILVVILLYAPEDEFTRKIVSSLKFNFSPEGLDSNTASVDIDIAIGRLFEKLEHIDHAIHSKLMAGPAKIGKWQEGYFCNTIFSDPLIQWRYASFMYRKREYVNALQETNVGIAVYDQLDELKRRGATVKFQVPDRSLFIRRRIEYELCAEVRNLKFATLSVAGIVELCNNILAHSETWNASLDEVIRESNDLTERARCRCFKILFNLCSVSSGGLGGHGLEVVREAHRTYFADLEKEISRHRPNSVKDRTWWLLSKSIMSEKDSSKCLEQFSRRIREVIHHPHERKHFEEACAKLITLWIPSEGVLVARDEFTKNMLDMLKDQMDRLATSEVLNQIAIERAKQVSELLAEVTKELSDKGKIEHTETVRKRLAEFVSDAVGHIVVDTAVAGLRSVLGI
jgi:hypothetical protein